MTTLTKVAATLAALPAISLLGARPLPGQDLNILLPADSIESLFRTADFQMLGWTGSRWEKDRTQRVVLRFDERTLMLAKWAMAPRGGVGVFNNRPRYEIAAYELQKLFLDESEYVVPPTVARCVSVQWYRANFPRAHATFENTGSVLVVLQYWLQNVTAQDVWDRGRFETDMTYALHFANLNLFTYLIRHSDSNRGNILVSSIDAFPRVFTVDNGVAFNRREESDRETRWRNLRVKRLPRRTVERLRALTLEDLQRELSVVAQFQQVGHQFVDVEPTEPLDRNRGMRNRDNVVQLGLTKTEIGHIWGRIQEVLKKVDEEKIVLF